MSGSSQGPILTIELLQQEPKCIESDLLYDIRKRYFDNNCKVIKSRKHIISDDTTAGKICASYLIKDNSLLKFSVKRDQSVTSEVNKINQEYYSVCVYSTLYNLKLIKETIFSSSHILTGAKYYLSNSTLPSVEIYLSEKGIGNKRNLELRYIEMQKDPKVLIPFSVPAGFDVMSLASLAKAKVPVCLHCLSADMYFAEKKDAKLILQTAKAMVEKNAVKYSDKGFAFRPDDFVREKLPKDRYNIIDSAKHIGKPKPIDINNNQNVNNNIDCQVKDITPKVNISRPAVNNNIPKHSYVINSKDVKYLYYGELDDNYNRTGLGVTELKDVGIAYYGNYNNDKRNGFGAYYYKDGKPCYFGNWDNDMRSGLGLGYKNNSKEAHIGIWSKNLQNGVGVRFDNNDNFMYLANFKDGKRDGLCISFTADGKLVVSKYSNGEQVIVEKIIDVDKL